jgi:2-methylisocitrate lyase-like PEP mutase family enzyme
MTPVPPWNVSRLPASQSTSLVRMSSSLRVLRDCFSTLSAVKPAIDKLIAFADAGADCLYAPGAHSRADIAALVKAVAPKPLNIVMMRQGLSFRELSDLGVRRVSIGGALARVMWASAIAAARQLQEGRFEVLGSGVPGAGLDAMFRPFAGA